MKTKYKIHHFDLRMTENKDKLELFLNSLNGKVVTIIPKDKEMSIGKGLD
jgi:hypothetical protein